MGCTSSGLRELRSRQQANSGPSRAGQPRAIPLLTCADHACVGATAGCSEHVLVIAAKSREYCSSASPDRASGTQAARTLASNKLHIDEFQSAPMHFSDCSAACPQQPSLPSLPSALCSCSPPLHRAHRPLRVAPLHQMRDGICQYRILREPPGSRVKVQLTGY